ncbi:MAG: hypothetical protein CL678_17870 [Bdellovibrionaceae bacterium]|nr:hypothetical protein [Pseudobdellovibrionaceae bacterium]
MKAHFSLILISLISTLAHADLDLSGCRDPEIGIPELRKDIRRSRYRGSKCLRRYGWNEQAEALKNIWNHKQVKFKCDIPGGSVRLKKAGMYPVGISHTVKAISTSKNDPDFPAVLLNSKDYLFRSWRIKQSRIFHESIHWLGYKHFDQFDLPLFAQACCFGVEDRETTQLACEFLSQKEKNIDIESEKYLSTLTLLLIEKNIKFSDFLLKYFWKVHTYKKQKINKKDILPWVNSLLLYSPKNDSGVPQIEDASIALMAMTFKLFFTKAIEDLQTAAQLNDLVVSYFLAHPQWKASAQQLAEIAYTILSQKWIALGISDLKLEKNENDLCKKTTGNEKIEIKKWIKQLEKTLDFRRFQSDGNSESKQTLNEIFKNGYAFMPLCLVHTK